MRLPLVPRWTRWAALVGVAALIAGFSVVRLPPGFGATGPFGVLQLSEYGHLLAYAGLAGVLAYALVDTTWSDGQVLVVVFLVAVGYGLGLELVQRLLPYRRFDPGDLLLNAGGTTVAIVAWRFVIARARFYRVGPGVSDPGE